MATAPKPKAKMSPVKAGGAKTRAAETPATATLALAAGPATGTDPKPTVKATSKTRAKTKTRTDSKTSGKAAPAPAKKSRAAGAKKRPAKRGGPAAALAPVSYGAGPLIDGDPALSAALALLRAIDPEVIDHLLEVGGHPPLRLRAPGFAGLAAIITSQQVSTASADAIFGRLTAAIAPLTAETLLAASEETLKLAGLSGAKIRTMRALAEAVVGGALPLEALGELSAEQAHHTLVAVKGIGPWTADIFLLFCLGHPDAWPAGDIALQEAARVALKLAARPTTIELSHIGERWRPHRGVAARLLWAYYRVLKQGRSGMSLDADPEQ